MNFHPIPSRPDLDKRSPIHLTKFDTHEQHLLSTLTLKTASSCSSATKELMTYIHFVQAWEQHLLSHDAAFLFLNTYPGKQAFSTATSGQPPSIFAVTFAKRSFASGTLSPLGQLSTTIAAMLSFWDDRASTWQTLYPSPSAARKALKACLPTTPGHEIYGPELAPLSLLHTKLGQGLLIPQRIFRNPPGDTEEKKEHTNTVFLMPLLPRLGNGEVILRHKLLGMRRCHEECGVSPPELRRVDVEGFRRRCFGNGTKVDWGFDELQRSFLSVDFGDPVDGAV